MAIGYRIGRGYHQCILTFELDVEVTIKCEIQSFSSVTSTFSSYSETGRHAHEHTVISNPQMSVRTVDFDCYPQVFIFI